MKTLIVMSLLLVSLLFFGPYEPFTGEITFTEEALDEDLNIYLRRNEAKFNDIRNGLHKQIIWHEGKEGEKTDIALVYLHGFSASLGEIRPVPDKIAEALGANLYYTRLTGHGRDREAMAEASADDWLDDTAEAIAIGSRLGKTLIIMSTSTGGSLAAYIHAQKPRWGEKIAGHIMVSPNFGLADPSSILLELPFARQFVPILIGKERGIRSDHASVNHIWTFPHATSALMPLARLTRQAAQSPLERINSPVLVLRSLKDKTVSPAATTRAIRRFSGPVDEVMIENSGHANHHVLAGDAVSPATNQQVIAASLDWIGKYFPQN